MARLPFSPIDVLVVDEIGKNISGSGMDTNVIGRPSNPHEPFPGDPKILWIVALDLTDESDGNATGIGNADFTTRRLAEKIDWKPTAHQLPHRLRPQRGQAARSPSRPTARRWRPR